GLAVDLQPGDVADAHHVDLGSRLVAAALVAGEQVAGRYRVRAVVLGVDADDLAVQVVGVAGGTPCVLEREALVVGGPVVAGVAVGTTGGVVVTRADVQVAVVVEGHPAAGVAAAVDLGGPLQQILAGVLVDRVLLRVIGEPRDGALADALVAVDGLV